MDEQRAGTPPVSPEPTPFSLHHGIRSAYDREVAEVKENILRMGFLVEQQVRAAIGALIAHDADAAYAVILDDRAINELQRKATAMIAAVIATQNPVEYVATGHLSEALRDRFEHLGLTYQSPAEEAVIVAAAYPIWSDNEVVGAVVAEETTNSILSVRSRALERLLLATLVSFFTLSAFLWVMQTSLG